MPSLRPPRGATGKAYWRSLDELADSPQFRKFVEREFPSWADEMLAPASRRGFLKLMGASLALAGATGCRWPTEEILPFADRPEGFTPGVPQRFATVMELGGSARGLVVTSHDGRPVKIEGNELHPQSLGATDARAQASVLELYDPDRSRNVVRFDGGGELRQRWSDFERFADERFAALRAALGEGLRVLAESSSSPSLQRMRSRFQREFPRARWHEYEPISRDNEREGSILAFGRPYRTQLALDRADVVVALDADFLSQHPAALRYARDWVSGRKPEEAQGAATDNGTVAADAPPDFNRLWAVESHYSLTGSVADHRVALPSRMVPVMAACLATELFLELELGLPATAEPLRHTLERYELHPLYTELDLGLAADLLAHRGRSLIVAGPRQPAEVHALAHLMNAALGNVGRTLHYTEEPDGDRSHHFRSIRALAEEMAEGDVGTLLILGGNPLFDAPADLDFASLLPRVETSIHLGLYKNETSRACAWHVPRAHFLEAWGDARGWDGTYSVAQPLIAPLYDGMSPIELIARVLGDQPRKGHDIVRATFASIHGNGDAESAWRKTLHDGLLENSHAAAAPTRVQVEPWADRFKAHLQARADAQLPQLELVFVESAGVYDGRFANSGWLQEMPDSLSKLTWDNALLISPLTARELDLKLGDMLSVANGSRVVELPVYPLPGQAEGSLSVALGYGRRDCGSVGQAVGFDVYPLRTISSMNRVDVRVERVPGHHELSTTQDHHAIDPLGQREREERAHHLVRELEVDSFRENPHAVQDFEHALPPVELWQPKQYTGHKWGMSIDLNACIGCNACMIACQAENNIPVVGKQEVINGREMHWIRVDRYFSGEVDDPSVVYQPVACHHCEDAPCEQVCPVAATVHDKEGLNVMVYNRCIGTRYCANNCPFKVRRFNYFNNAKGQTPLRQMANNPEVTVRTRGVMEKCTYCVQRINSVKIQAKNERRPVRDGEITPACAQVCPTRAIVFGDLNDPESRVARRQADRRSYAMLEETQIKPRTRYMARLRNRSPRGGGGHSGAA